MKLPALATFCLSLLFLNVIACQSTREAVSSQQPGSEDDQYVSIARVEKGDKVGYVNGWGEEVLPVEFDEGSFQFHENRITVRKGENWYIYDVQGNLLLDLEDQYKYVGFSGDDLFFVSNTVTREKSNYYFHYRFELDELQFIDLSGEEKVVVKHGLKLAIEYPRNMRFQNGFLPLEVAACPRCANKLMGFADHTGKVVMEPVFHPLTTKYLFSEGLLCVGNDKYEMSRDSKTRYGFINTSGQWVIEPTYLWSADAYFVDGAAIVDSTTVSDDPSNKSTFSNPFLINPKGERVFPRDVHVMRNAVIQDSIVIVEKYFGEHNKFALAKTDGTYVTDFEFDFINPYRGQGHYTADIGRDRIYLNRNGEQIHTTLTQRENEARDPTVFSGLSRPGNYVDGLSLVYLEDQQTAVIDMDGHIILSYPDQSPSIEGGIIKAILSYANSAEGLVYQYYDRKGQPITFKDYDKVFEFQYLKLEE